MNWTQVLKDQAHGTYAARAKLSEQVDATSLGWIPATGSNWLTVGQLLKHLSNACGAGCKGFVCGDWGLAPGVKIEELPPEHMLPKAEAFPTIDTLDNAKQLLREDEALTLQMIDQAGEEALATRRMEAPWLPGKQLLLGQWLLQMIQHLDRHKSQLFYYLKLQGRPVNTADLWGM